MADRINIDMIVRALTEGFPELAGKFASIEQAQAKLGDRTGQVDAITRQFLSTIDGQVAAFEGLAVGIDEVDEGAAQHRDQILMWNQDYQRLNVTSNELRDSLIRVSGGTEEVSQAQEIAEKTTQSLWERFRGLGLEIGRVARAFAVYFTAAALVSRVTKSIREGADAAAESLGDLGVVTGELKDRTAEVDTQLGFIHLPLVVRIRQAWLDLKEEFLSNSEAQIILGKALEMGIITMEEYLEIQGRVAAAAREGGDLFEIQARQQAIWQEAAAEIIPVMQDIENASREAGKAIVMLPDAGIVLESELPSLLTPLDVIYKKLVQILGSASAARRALGLLADVDANMPTLGGGFTGQGGGGGGGGGGQPYSQGTSAQSGMGVVGQASGGPLADRALVGEEGPEMIIDGVVIPTQITKILMSLGLVPRRRLQKGGDLGGFLGADDSVIINPGFGTVDASNLHKVREDDFNLRTLKAAGSGSSVSTQGVAMLAAQAAVQGNSAGAAAQTQQISQQQLARFSSEQEALRKSIEGKMDELIKITKKQPGALAHEVASELALKL